MFRKYLQPIGMALESIRANLFHTLLSVLGIVIGVAALVSILSLIDGLEKYVRDSITEKTSLKAVAIDTKEYREVNHLAVRKDSFQVIDYDRFNRLLAAVGEYDRTFLSATFTREIKVPGQAEPMGAVLTAMADNPGGDTLLASGKLLAPEVFSGKKNEALVNSVLAHLLDSTGQVLGKTFETMGRAFTITGVFKSGKEDAPPSAVLPISVFTIAELRQSPPDCFVEAREVESVHTVKEKVKQWIATEFGAQNTDFEVITQDLRVDDAAQGFMIFRIIMGLIVGISVLVGGVGVMNVLLISVNERTAEIGMRKAVGAKKSDIMRLFLSESIVISSFGSLLGLLVGMGFTTTALAIVRAIKDVPIHAAFTLNTLLVISVVALLIGIVFGTYPALKAARLDPVEAIRHE